MNETGPSDAVTADQAEKMALECVRNGNLDEALGWWLEAIRLDPTRSLFTYRAGKMCAVLGRHEEAVKLLAQSIEQNRDHAATRFSYASALACVGEFARAIEELNIVLAAHPLNDSAASLKFQCLVLEGSYGIAANYFFERATKMTSSRDKLCNAFSKAALANENYLDGLSASQMKQLRSILSGPDDAERRRRLGKAVLRCASRV